MIPKQWTVAVLVGSFGWTIGATGIAVLVPETLVTMYSPKLYEETFDACRRLSPACAVYQISRTDTF